MKIIYSFQDNYESYNILNPLRKGKSGEIELDSVTSITVSVLFIIVSIWGLLTFKKLK